jgi:hypothetical protein
MFVIQIFYWKKARMLLIFGNSIEATKRRAATDLERRWIKRGASFETAASRLPQDEEYLELSNSTSC